MKIGRNFTNMLLTSYLNEEERKLFGEGKLAVHDMDARVQIRSKRDIINQVDVAKEIGLDHVELDGGVPNPYLEMSQEELAQAKEHAEKVGISLSLHLPYTYVAASTICFQESDRKIAVELQKRYLDVAQALGCISVVMHPGSVPYYQAMGEYLAILRESMAQTLMDLYPYAADRGIILHLENNTAFDTFGVYNFEMIDILNEVNSRGCDVKYCFDIGHLLTIDLPMHKENFNKESIPERPEDLLEDIPAELFYKVHLNDFWINRDPEGEGKGEPPFKFHPPLHRETGFLKKENLIRFAEILRSKGAELIIVETAVRDIEDLLNAKQIIADETAYLNEVLK